MVSGWIGGTGGRRTYFVLYSSRCLRAGCGCSLSRDYEFLPVTAVMTAALGWFGTQKKCLARAAADKSLRVRYRVPAQGPKKTQRWRSSSLAAVSLRPARGVPYLGACELTVIVPALPPPYELRAYILTKSKPKDDRELNCVVVSRLVIVFVDGVAY